MPPAMRVNRRVDRDLKLTEERRRGVSVLANTLLSPADANLERAASAIH